MDAPDRAGAARDVQRRDVHDVVDGFDRYPRWSVGERPYRQASGVSFAAEPLSLLATSRLCADASNDQRGWLFNAPRAPPPSLSPSLSRSPSTWCGDRAPTLQTPDNGEHIDASIELVHGIVAAEVAAGVAPERIVIGGFSQGAALALSAALTIATPIGGALVFSGWAPPKQSLSDVAAAKTAAFKSTSKFLVCHGSDDMTVSAGPIYNGRCTWCVRAGAP